MLIFGIESSCDETAASVVEDGRIIRSNVVATQIELHALYGGVVPEIASRAHTEAISGVAEEAFRQAGISPEEIDAVAVTYAPGLIGALLTGLSFAKGFAYSMKKPIVPVHHLRGHIAANYLVWPELKPPFIAICVSGGNTELTLFLKLSADGSTFIPAGENALRWGGPTDAAGVRLREALRAYGNKHPREWLGLG